MRAKKLHVKRFVMHFFLHNTMYKIVRVHSNPVKFYEYFVVKQCRCYKENSLCSFSKRLSFILLRMTNSILRQTFFIRIIWQRQHNRTASLCHCRFARSLCRFVENFANKTSWLLFLRLLRQLSLSADLNKQFIFCGKPSIVVVNTVSCYLLKCFGSFISRVFYFIMSKLSKPNKYTLSK